MMECAPIACLAIHVREWLEDLYRIAWWMLLLAISPQSCDPISRRTNPCAPFGFYGDGDLI